MRFSNITSDATVNYRGGLGASEENVGEAGTLTGKACPKGLYGLYCEVVLNSRMCPCFYPQHFWFNTLQPFTCFINLLQECPAGTYKNVTGSDEALCHLCPARDIPRRAVYVTVRGTSFK